MRPLSAGASLDYVAVVVGPRALLGLVLGLAGHGVAFGAGFVVARLVRPSPGGGFEDIAAAVVTLIVVELAWLLAGVVLLVRGRRELGGGWLVGWLLGAFVAWLFIRNRTISR